MKLTNMKLYTPVKVADSRMDCGLLVSILIVGLTLFTLGIIFNPIILVGSIITLALFRVGKAIIKGE